MAVEMAPDSALPPAVERAVETFATRLEPALGNRLVSLTLYGSVLQGGYRPAASDLNLLLIVTRPDAPLLAEVGAAAVGRLPLAPVVLAPADLAASAISAPLVLFDLRDHRRLLRGEDPLAGLELDLTDLARQLRFELRDKLYRLRAIYQAEHHRPKELAATAARSYGSVMHLLRNVLRLYGQPAAGNPIQTLGAVARTLKLDLNTLRGLHALRYEQDREQRGRIGAMFESYLALLQQAVERVEALPWDDLPAPAAEPEEATEISPPEPTAGVPEGDDEPLPEQGEPAAEEPIVAPRAAPAAEASEEADPTEIDAAPAAEEAEAEVVDPTPAELSLEVGEPEAVTPKPSPTPPEGIAPESAEPVEAVTPAVEEDDPAGSEAPAEPVAEEDEP